MGEIPQQKKKKKAQKKRCLNKQKGKVFGRRMNGMEFKNMSEMNSVTFIEVTFMLGCPYSCIIGHHIILPLVQPIGVSYPFVYTILIETGHISNMKDGGIMCNSRNISLKVYNPNAIINVYVLLCIQS